ncbi:MAG: phosphatase PAP2 family protein, partial [Actinomycetes bacterium]
MSAPRASSGTTRALLAVALVCAAAVAFVTSVVVTTGRLFGLDARALAFFSRAPQSGIRHSIVVALSFTASAPVGIALLVLLGLGLSYRRRSYRPLVFTTLMTVALVGFVYVTKDLVGRARPGVAAIVDPEPGFPSGHTATATVVAGTALVLLCASVSPTVRRWAVAGVVVYAAAIGLSRLYLQLHWFSDVLAGWLIGTLIVCVGGALLLARTAD